MNSLWIYPLVVWSGRLIAAHAPYHDQESPEKHQVFRIDVLTGTAESDILTGPGPRIDPLSGEPMAPAIPDQPSQEADAIEPTMSISMDPTSDSLYPVFLGKTNLPDESLLNFELRCPPPPDRECYGWVTAVKVVDGGFETERPYRQIKPNAYSVQITMFPSLQGPEIQQLVGSGGELMKGAMTRDEGGERIFQFDGIIQTGDGSR